ncbi:MAG TPA: aspartate aminotransferase family protein [Chthoniobacterales bacterium]|jgi:acetylornithine aminotransferase/acetylornithine/N-succinyldiaminopimelate aminotransferase|nr:aspartate aminotransferase family protein [Chthoniobacterales bacterium]
MKEVLAPPKSAIVRNETKRIRELFDQFVVPSYSRFDLVLERGEGSYVWDVDGKRYLDLAGGIAVCSLGHAHPEITKALTEQAKKLIHVSNLYYTEPQGQLAKRIIDHIGPGRVFFCNSGAEANEGLFKLARKFGHAEGRYEIITTTDSFHGRTLAGIAATGQEKIKKGFAPEVVGFSQVPFNNVEAMRRTITKSTAAILVEPVQGESGITIAKTEYLIGLRQLCDEHNLLLLFDEVQAGHFRTGKFQSWQRILETEDVDLLPDGVSMAKSLGGGFPMGAFWVREKFANVLSPGTHASTFGGTPLACAVALRIFEVIERENLAANAREVGQFILDELQKVREKFSNVLKVVRGIGLMIGIEFQPKFKAADIVKELHKRNLLTVPAGNSVIRLLPALNLSRAEAEQGLRTIEGLVVDLAKKQ